MRILLLLILAVSFNANGRSVELFNGNKFEVQYHFKASFSEVDKEYKKLMKGAESMETEKGNATSRHGFSYMRGKVCNIVIISPDKIKFTKFEKIHGHEMNHCLFGTFHKPMKRTPSRVSFNN